MTEAIIHKKSYGFCLEYKNEEGRNVVVPHHDLEMLLNAVKGKVDRLLITYI